MEGNCISNNKKLEGAVQVLGVQVVCDKFGWRCEHRDSMGRGVGQLVRVRS